MGRRDSLDGIRSPDRPARTKSLCQLRYLCALLFCRSKVRSEGKVKEAKASVSGLFSTQKLLGAESIKFRRGNSGGVGLDHSSKKQD